MSFREVIRCFRLKLRKIKINLSGRPKDDLSFKQQTILETGKKFSCDILIETGTYCGDTVNVARYYFDSIISIELSKDLHSKNKERFKNVQNVALHNGDSGKLLKEILKSIDEERIIFWLDAHYSGIGTATTKTSCSIMGELEAIASHSRNHHCILIDDATLFGSDPDYPKLDEVIHFLKNINNNYEISVNNNIIMAVSPHLSN